MNVLAWLFDSEPAIRWQVMRDLVGEPIQVVAAERSKVATEGWGARLLALQDPDGQWGTDALPQASKPSGGGLLDAATRKLLRELHHISLDDLGNRPVISRLLRPPKNGRDSRLLPTATSETNQRRYQEANSNHTPLLWGS